MHHATTINELQEVIKQQNGAIEHYGKTIADLETKLKNANTEIKVLTQRAENSEHNFEQQHEETQELQTVISKLESQLQNEIIVKVGAQGALMHSLELLTQVNEYLEPHANDVARGDWFGSPEDGETVLNIFNHPIMVQCRAMKVQNFG